MLKKHNFNYKFSLFALAVTFFGVGVTEFISVGVLPDIANDFNISTSTAGLVTSIYALGVALGAPILTILTAKMNKKNVILSAIILFIVGHLIITFAPSFIIVLLGRLIAAFAHGIIFAISSNMAANLVSKDKQAWAIAFIFGGFTLATAIGAPLGTAISNLLGWRLPFFLIALIGVLAFILNAIVLPKNSFKNAELPTFKEQLKLTFNPHILLVLLLTILGYGGTFATFTYLSPILENITKVPYSQISFILVIYGVAIAIGNNYGGKINNNNPVYSLFKIFTIQAIALLAFYFTSPNYILSIINIIVLGLLAFMSVPILQSHVLDIAQEKVPSAVDIASSLNIMSFSAGITLGSYLGGVFITMYTVRSTTIIASILVGSASILALFIMGLNKKIE